jgi:hypothetical protein
MVKDDDVHLVDFIVHIGSPCGGKFDGTPPTSNVQSVHMHGFIGVGSIAATLDFDEVEIQLLAII